MRRAALPYGEAALIHSQNLKAVLDQSGLAGLSVAARSEETPLVARSLDFVFFVARNQYLVPAVVARDDVGFLNQVTHLLQGHARHGGNRSGSETLAYHRDNALSI